MREEIDIGDLSFDQFVAFLFDREVPPESGEQINRWYRRIRPTFNLARICSYYDQLFRESSFLLTSFTEQQLLMGFTAIQRPGLTCSAEAVIWNTDLAFSQREECVSSMFYLYRDLFAKNPLGHTASMWWDSFCFAWECGNRCRSRGGEDLAMQDVFFETITRCLEINSDICQGAALHGLEHLHHPRTEAVVNRFLRANPFLGEEMRQCTLRIVEFVDRPQWTRRQPQGRP
jgi:hypothetical protein